MKNLKSTSPALRLLVALFALGLLAGCQLLPNSRGEQRALGGAAPSPTPIPTAIVPNSPTYTVQRGEVVDEMTFSGRVAPVTQEGLFFETSGRVRTVFVQRNDQVEAGTVIAELEIDDLERALTAAQLELERAQTLLDAAERDLAFDQRAAEINLEMAQLQLTALQAESAGSNDAALQERRVELAEIAVERLDEGADPLLTNAVSRAELEVQRLDAAIAEARVVAPFAGELIALTLSPGSAVEAFSPVATIADMAQLEASADLTSSQMERMEEGMTVSVALNSSPGETFGGTVRSLPFPYGSGGLADSGAGITTVENRTLIGLDEAATAELEMGNLVRIVAELERKDDVLWLPPQALRNFDGRRFALVQDGDAQRRVDVAVGIQTEERIEVVEGLEEGQTVVGP